MNSENNKTESSNLSVSRALDILEFLNTSGKSMTISEICRSLSLNRITCTNLIKTLIAKKYLYKDVNGKICLSGKIYLMGQVYRDGFPLIGIFNDAVLSITEKYHCSAHFLVFSGLNQAVMLSQVPAQFVYTSHVLPVCYPLNCSASGKVLLAFQPDEVRSRILPTLEYQRRTENTITSPEALEEELGKIRRQKYGTDDEEFRAGLRCISAPVFNADGTVTSAVSLSSLPAEKNFNFTNYLPDLYNLANMLSRASGYRDVDLNSL